MEAKIINKDEFKQDSFVTTNKTDGIDVVLGKLKSGDDLIVQSYLFDESKFDEDTAKKWLVDNKIKYINLNVAKVKKINTDWPEFIDNYSMNKLIGQIEDVPENNVELPWFSYGGSVWGMNLLIDYLLNTDKKVDARVTGLAASAGATLLAYFNHVAGARESDIMIHSSLSTVNKLTKKTNQQLYEALASKIDEAKFKEITGEELKTIMFLEGEERKDVWITGQEAYDMGLFDEVFDLSPEQKQKKDALLDEFRLSASLGYELPKHLNINKNEKKQMDIDELKTSYPKVYDEVFNKGKDEGFKEGQDSEKKRVDAWAVFNDVDPEAVKAGIESGKEIEKAQELTLMRKAQLLDLRNDLEDGSPAGVNPNKKNATPKSDDQKKAEKENEELEAAFDNLNIPKEDK